MTQQLIILLFPKLFNLYSILEGPCDCECLPHLFGPMQPMLKYCFFLIRHYVYF